MTTWHKLDLKAWALRFSFGLTPIRCPCHGCWYGSRFIIIIIGIHGLQLFSYYSVFFKNSLMASERICLHDSVANEWQRVRYFFVLFTTRGCEAKNGILNVIHYRPVWAMEFYFNSYVTNVIRKGISIMGCGQDHNWGEVMRIYLVEFSERQIRRISQRGLLIEEL